MLDPVKGVVQAVSGGPGLAEGVGWGGHLKPKFKTCKPISGELTPLAALSFFDTSRNGVAVPQP